MCIYNKISFIYHHWKSLMKLSTVYACAFLVMVKIIKVLWIGRNIQWYCSMPFIHVPWYMWKLRGPVLYHSWLIGSYWLLQAVARNCRPLWLRSYIIHFEGIGNLQYSSSNSGPSEEGCTIKDFRCWLIFKDCTVTLEDSTVPWISLNKRIDIIVVSYVERPLSSSGLTGLKRIRPNASVEL